MARRNDEDRQLWVLHDEGLWQASQAQGGVYSFIKKNRAMIDEFIDKAMSSKPPYRFIRKEVRNWKIV